ncbi:MAG: DivIVA domain-containing protein [Fimbriimonadaceae bacterium]|nr:DivIVA domain-containing protein [Chthonomonadaceae bacterium]MCO5296092.1 DivIVA domain-containing protein [Fimbriimonadaceae bacterium]
MERILPIDLERLEIRRALRGYDRPTVDEWLQKAALEIETLIKEIQASRELCERQRSELEVHRAQEDTLREALLLAQKTADETRAAAHREAEQILDRARLDAGEAHRAAMGRLERVRDEIARTRSEGARLAGALRALAESTARSLDESSPLAVVEGHAVPQ